MLSGKRDGNSIKQKKASVDHWANLSRYPIVWLSDTGSALIDFAEYTSLNSNADQKVKQHHNDSNFSNVSLGE